MKKRIRLLLEKLVLNSQELQEFRRHLQPYLFKNENQKIVEKLSKFLYSKLDDNDKKELDKKTIITFILQLGVNSSTQVSRREALDYIKKHNKFLKKEDDILTRIFDRYLSEELSNTPIEDTEKRIEELKKEAVTLYASIK